MTADGIKINPFIILKFFMKIEMPLSQHPYLCYILLFLLVRIAGRLTSAFQELNLPKRKILLCIHAIQT